MEILPAFPRQTKPRGRPTARHSPLRPFEPGKYWPFLWDGVSMAREQVRLCWYGKFIAIPYLLPDHVCLRVVCSSVGLQHWESGRVTGLLWDQAQRLGGGWVRPGEELHTHTHRHTDEYFSGFANPSAINRFPDWWDCQHISKDHCSWFITLYGKHTSSTPVQPPSRYIRGYNSFLFRSVVSWSSWLYLLVEQK